MRVAFDSQRAHGEQHDSVARVLDKKRVSLRFLEENLEKNGRGGDGDSPRLLEARCTTRAQGNAEMEGNRPHAEE